MKKGIQIWLIYLVFMNLHYNYIYGQTPPCAFDEFINYNLQEIPDFQFRIEQGQNQMDEMMSSNPQAAMNGGVYTIPVVFHIIHKGEPMGFESNIPEALIIQALDYLNSHFRNSQMLGTDSEIQFCLAQRDPQGGAQFNSSGVNITGIQRVNGSSVLSYQVGGISTRNEREVKALSNWPNTDYLNIWIVWQISPSGVLGYATFPGADDGLDGIVMLSSAIGTVSDSNILSHEVGHFLFLYHTFEGSSISSQCPPNADCTMDGDKVCDTRPHSNMNQTNNWFPCVETQYHN